MGKYIIYSIGAKCMIDINTWGDLTQEGGMTSAQRESRGPQSKAGISLKFRLNNHGELAVPWQVHVKNCVVF